MRTKWKFLIAITAGLLILTTPITIFEAGLMDADTRWMLALNYKEVLLVVFGIWIGSFVAESKGSVQVKGATSMVIILLMIGLTNQFETEKRDAFTERNFAAALIHQGSTSQITSEQILDQLSSCSSQGFTLADISSDAEQLEVNCQSVCDRRHDSRQCSFALAGFPEGDVLPDATISEMRREFTTCNVNVKISPASETPNALKCWCCE
ncbi:MAG: hypothetical protein ABIH34_04980 [Nanoarchaeota archaeon]